MLGDLFLSIDDIEPAQHRERVAALILRGYDVVASVHTVTGLLTQAHKYGFWSRRGTHALTPFTNQSLRRVYIASPPELFRTSCVCKSVLAYYPTMPCSVRLAQHGAIAQANTGKG